MSEVNDGVPENLASNPSEHYYPDVISRVPEVAEDEVRSESGHPIEQMRSVSPVYENLDEPVDRHRDRGSAGLSHQISREHRAVLEPDKYDVAQQRPSNVLIDVKRILQIGEERKQKAFDALVDQWG